MPHNNPSVNRVSSPGWQTLGELELTAGFVSEHTVNKWLAVSLSRLDLHADFLDKVLKAAQETVSRAIQAEGVRKFEHLHLLIFVPAKHIQNNQNWGFYRIEKVEQAAGKANPDHTIEFYLYQDGK
jgi:hypothetical protein